MNWVGGSRNRLVVKNDAKKQKEFFAKRKLQQKLKNMGVAPSSSAGDICSGSTDLLTLFVVNQIASKKTNQEPPKLAVFGRSKRSRHRASEPIVLPMSPCSPSHLSLVESPAQSSVRGIRKRNSPQRIKYGQLSPVLESGFSDNSASDYLPPINDPATSISPSASSSTCQGLFPLQMNLQNQGQTQSQPLPHFSPLLWDTSVLKEPQFQPFSQPRGMTDPVSWSVRSNPPSFQLVTPTASQVLFGSPKPNETEARGHRGHSGHFTLNQLEPKQPILEVQISQSEPIHLFEEEVFKMCNNNKQGTESSPFSSKLYLRDKSSVRPSSPQTVPNPQAVGMELSNCTDTNSSCLRQNAGLLKSFEYSPSCSCRAGYLSSDSDDDEPCCESCHQDFAFYVDERCCSDNLRPASPRITVLSQPRPLTPLMRSKMNAGDNQNMTVSEASTDKASGSQQTGSFMALSSSPDPLGETPNSEMCICKKTLTESQDAGTQTAYTSVADTRDASTQCSFVANSETRASGFTLCRPAVPANETETDLEPQTLRAPSKGTASKDGCSPWSWKKSSKTGSGIFHNVTAENILQRPINPLLGVWSPRGEENGERREQTGQDENNPLVKEVFDEERQEVTSVGRGHTLSEEAEMLREIADVLLLLKQRKNDQK